MFQSPCPRMLFSVRGWTPSDAEGRQLGLLDSRRSRPSQQKVDTWQLCIRWQVHRLVPLLISYPFRGSALRALLPFRGHPTHHQRLISYSTTSRLFCTKNLSPQLPLLRPSEPLPIRGCPSSCLLVWFLFRRNLPSDHISTGPRRARTSSHRQHSRLRWDSLRG